MRETILNQRIGSLCFDGEMMEFIPADMKYDGQVFFSEAEGIRFEYTIDFPEEDAFYASLRIRNLSGRNSPNISQVNSVDIPFRKTGKPILETIAGDCCSAKSYRAQKKDMPVGYCYNASPTGGRSANTTAFPYFDITDGDSTFVFGIGWSGQWQLHIPVLEDLFRVKVGLCRCDFYLKPGESVLLPSVLCKKGKGVAETRNLFRNLLRRHYSPQAGQKDDLFRPISFLLGSCFDDGRNSVDNLKKEVELSSVLGFEVAWADAIWFRGGWDLGVGNYMFKDFLPDGLRPISDLAHARNMKYLQWFEIERAFPKTEMYTEHADLLLWCPTRTEFKLVDLGNEKTWDFLFDRLSGMIEEQRIDILRIDANIDPLLFWEYNDEPDRWGVKEMHYIEGLYRLWDALLARFPGLTIDNCASGGRRLDFELMRRSVSYCRSDYTNGGIHGDMGRYAGVHTMNLNRYLPYTSPILRSRATPYLCRLCFTGSACFGAGFLDASTWELAKALLEECKRVRPLWNGDFYALVGQEDSWSAYQVDRDGEGAVYFLRHTGSSNDRLRVKLRGLDEEAHYRVVVTDEKMEVTEYQVRGKRLAEDLEVVIGSPEESALVEYKKL